MRKCKNLTEKIFGRLKVIKRVENIGKCSAWLCKCECGNEKIIIGNHLRHGNTKSCGCIRREKMKEKMFKHGAFGTKEYGTLNNIKYRCNNINCAEYKNYGGRGIKVCDRWLNPEKGFLNFLEDVGYAPGPEYSIERINNEGNYEPGNIEWTIMKKQSRNRRTNIWIEYNGMSFIQKDWSINLHVTEDFILTRLKKNIPFPEIVKQAKEHNFKKHWHEDLSQSDFENGLV